jgi:hypothetical protein
LWCGQTAPLSLVYGPTDNTNYTIWTQAENIRSRPEEWEESLTQCMGLCYGELPSIPSFSPYSLLKIAIFCTRRMRGFEEKNGVVVVVIVVVIVVVSILTVSLFRGG